MGEKISQANDSLENSIISDELTSITSDLLEVGLDSFLKDGVLKEIPIVGNLVGLTMIGIGIRDRIFMKKILNFLYELKDIPVKKREEFVSKINSEQEYSGKVGETILVIIDKLDDIKKAELIGKLFCYAVNEKIDYDTFHRLSIIIERCFLKDLQKLRTFYNGNKSQIEDFDKHQLYNLGLLKNIGVDGATYLGGENTRNMIDFEISQYGSLLVELLLIQ